MIKSRLTYYCFKFCIKVSPLLPVSEVSHSHWTTFPLDIQLSPSFSTGSRYHFHYISISISVFSLWFHWPTYSYVSSNLKVYDLISDCSDHCSSFFFQIFHTSFFHMNFGISLFSSNPQLLYSFFLKFFSSDGNWYLWLLVLTIILIKFKLEYLNLIVFIWHYNVSHLPRLGKTFQLFYFLLFNFFKF